MTGQDLAILLTDLRSQPQEQQWLEFKVNAITNEEIGEYISSLSNGATVANQPFGYLVLGVEDKSHAIQGTRFSFVKAKQGNQALELWLRDLLQPKINFEIFEFDVQKKHVVLLRIPAALKVAREKFKEKNGNAPYYKEIDKKGNAENPEYPIQVFS
jgi:ATP-dependent DNA helicase RecG